MGFRCGIVGLPNVGKSTLFNALTETQAAQAANYPFCTIEPNVGQVGVPDPRLDKLAAIAGSAKIIPTQLGFVDIAGLVRGASKGEGLGNQFLSHIRECDAIVQVGRCFEDPNVIHVENRVDPVADVATVPNNANACGADNDKLVLTSTGFTGPLLNENDPDTYTKSLTRNNTLSADAPTTGCSKSISTVAPPVGSE